jgi:predicted ATPase/DNA-binding SARP family transcriptional activator
VGATTLRFGILGPLEVTRGADPVDLGGPKQRVLMAILLVHRNAVIHADRIIDLLWDGKAPASASGTMHAYLSHLRKALRGDGEEPGSPIVTRPPGYALVVAPDATDADRFVALSDAAAAAQAARDHHRAVGLLDEALAMWRGAPLSDCGDLPFLREERVRLEELHVHTVEERMAAGLALGWHARLLPALQALAAKHPLRERLRGQLMLALYRSGRQVDALEVYSQARAQLAADLGIDPGPALQELERAILRQDSSLEISAAAPHGPAAPSSALVSGWRIPEPPSPIVGRQRDLQAVRGLVEDARLVTLTGAGGTGKTRLVLEVAQRLRAPGGDGPWMVEFAGLRQPALVANAVAQSLDLVVHGDREVMDVIADALALRSVVLVLDNCEHLLEAVRALVGALLKRCAGLTVLATSREPLRVPGEHLYLLAPLPVASQTDEGRLVDDEAMRLFEVRAAAVVPGFTITAENRRAVRRICEDLDGLPLAIELAASRMRVLSPEQLVERLKDRFTVLSGGDADAEPHERGLRAAVAWSVDLLDEHERQLFAALSTFRGGFELDAVDRLVPDSAVMVLDRLDALCAKSLVSVDTAVSPRRYGMLGTLQEYGRQVLSAEQAQGLAHRHAEWCADLVAAAERGLAGQDLQPWLRRMEQEQDNVRAALSFALHEGRVDLAADIAGSMGWYWIRRGQVDEARQWLERCAAAGQEVATGQMARVVFFLGMVAYMAGDAVLARRLGDEAMGLARRCEDLLVLAESTVYSSYFEALVDLDAADRRATRGLDLSRQLGQLSLEAEALTALGIFARYRGDLLLADRMVAEAGAVAQRAGDWWHERMARWGAARVALVHDRPADALRLLRGVAQDLQAVGYRSGALLVLQAVLAAAVRHHGDATGARLLGAVMAQAERLGYSPQHFDPADGDLYERIRRGLSDDDLAQALTRGRAMTSTELTALVDELTEG